MSAPAQHQTISPSVWDAFVESTPVGQFQQRAGWAAVKGVDGWQAERVAWPPREFEGGFQLLWKPSRFGRIGYVPKGPVLRVENAETVRRALAAVTEAARRIKLRAVIVQPPDESRITVAHLTAAGFAANELPGIVRATAIASLVGGKDAYLSRMSRQVRREVRVAGERGVTIRRGERKDLEQFFALMCGSCQRQNTRPNPSSVRPLQALWDAMPGKVMLGFAEAEGEAVAALLMIGHGRRLTFWKKGWNSKGAQLFANCLLNATAFDWAAEAGYAEIDFLAMGLENARTLLRGEALNEQQRRSRDVFNLRLGAEPRLLPGAHLHIVNPLWRRVFTLACVVPAFRRAAERRMGST